MYIQGNRQYEYHVKTYGHPSKFGFKDVIPTWKADKFDPDHLMQLYKKAGAKYFCSMGVHHDNFDLWKSTHQPRWNAVAIGAEEGHRRAVGRKPPQKQGLRFAVSEHLAPSYNWFSTSHTQRQDRPARRRALRRRRSRLRRSLSRIADGLSATAQRIRTIARRRIPGSSTTSSASRTWSTTTSPTCSTPMAASSSRNTAWRWWRTSTTRAPRCHGGRVRSRLHQQDAERLRDRNLRARSGARRRRRHSGQPLADRHLHRRLALQQGSEVQDRPSA